MPDRSPSSSPGPRSASTTSRRPPPRARCARGPRGRAARSPRCRPARRSRRRPGTCRARPSPRARRSRRASACGGTPRRSRAAKASLPGGAPHRPPTALLLALVARRRRPPRRRRRRGWTPDIARRRAPTRPRAHGRRQLRRADGAAGVELARRDDLPLGERREGDAARRLPAPRRRARPARCARGERALLDPMVRRSDNGAADAIHARVGAGGADARWGGGAGCATSSRTPSGAARRSPPPTRRASSCASTGSSRAATAPTRCGLLRGIVPEQRWGIAGGACRAAGEIAFKGGWGSGVTRQVDHQAALLTNAGLRVSVAVLTGRQPLRRLRRRHAARASRRGCCAGSPGASSEGSCGPRGREAPGAGL